MKKVITFLLPIIFLSCGTQKIEKINTQQRINEILDLKSVIINYPENWTYQLDHNGISYTPKKFSNDIYNCMIQVFKYNGSILEIGPINQTYKTLEELENEGLPIIIKNRFGETDLYKISEIKKVYDITFTKITLVLRFNYKNDYYILRYRADKEYFEEYLKDVDYFIDNLEFKEKNAEIQDLKSKLKQ